MALRRPATAEKGRPSFPAPDVTDYLSKSFEIKDLGQADVILNIKLQRGDEGGITLVQSHYVDKVLSRFGYSDCKPAPTPYDPSVLLRKNRRIVRDQLRYSQIIGSLMYLASATRPDISFAAREKVMRYLKGTMSYGIHYTGYPKVLEGYSDSNWISDADEIKATSGYVFTLAVIIKVNSSKDNMKSSRHIKRRLKSVRKQKNSGVIALDYIQTDGSCLNVIRVAFPSRDVDLQNISEGTHLYEFDC
uniref:Retrotransposon protein, putative, Ty1-copia subclass n=2 Tax=Oryza sativa subsp. japonica TaxID=39947 RepID=Q8S7R9_ORYSJ|nr:Putative gag-pol polyprotein [Oryza sativa Japonica Group]AAP51927.1 retrotransposon protein, putative, Ty1-copia subclass [Oryza sativa Japonica Group]